MKAKLVLFWLILMVGCTGCQVARTSQPVIGITSVYMPNRASGSPSISVKFRYVQAVVDAGGVPVVLPAVADEQTLERYLRELDGLVLVGGDDIPPAAYGEKPHDTVRVMPIQRYDFESRLIARWLAGGKPLLGICLGMQFTNVVAGGSLIQDIPSQVGKRVNHRGYHTVQIDPGSILDEILASDKIKVYSNHHQAVKKLGDSLKVIARSEDGVVEALERTNGPFGLFVQWHPEATDDLSSRRAIYDALVRAAAARN